MDIKNIGVFTIKVNLEEAFMADDPVRKDYKGVWVELREPTAGEAMDFQKEGDPMDVIPKFIISSSITNGDEKATPEEVAEALKVSSTVYTHMVNEWGKSLPLARKNPEMLEAQPDVSLEDSE